MTHFIKIFLYSPGPLTASTPTIFSLSFTPISSVPPTRILSPPSPSFLLLPVTLPPPPKLYTWYPCISTYALAQSISLTPPFPYLHHWVPSNTLTLHPPPLPIPLHSSLNLPHVTLNTPILHTLTYSLIPLPLPPPPFPFIPP